MSKIIIQKQMKKIVYFLSAILIFASCNFLDIVPDDTANIDDAFRNENTAQDFLFGVYSFVADPRNFRPRPGRATTNEVMAAAGWGAQWFHFKQHNRDQIGSTHGFGADVTTNFDGWNDIWLNNYRAIRQANMFLENIGNVRPALVSQQELDRMKREWRGEAYFIIAWMHHELFKNYGPIVIADGFVTTLQPRAHINDVVDFIVEMYDRAIELLPPSQPGTMMGRADAQIAKTMRARLLLYAASPLFNGDPEGVFANADPEFRALMNLQRDNARWQRALTAIDEAIDFVHAQGRQLFRHTGPDPVTGQAVTCPARQAYLNVRRKFITNWNIETIWGHGGGRRIEHNRWGDHTIPRGLGRANNLPPQTPGVGSTLVASMIFYSANGLPMESDPNRGFPWTSEGRMTVQPGNHTANLFMNREPRFHAAIGYHGGIFEFDGWTEFTLNMFWTPDGEGRDYFANGALGGWMDRMSAGLVIKKTANPAGASNPGQFLVEPQAFPVARLAELYLARAEADAELNGSLSARSRELLGRIHDRAGLGSTPFFVGFTGQELIEAIRRERMIELIFESHWHFDLRRWQMAYEWHNHGMWASVGKGDRDGMWGLWVEGYTNETFFRETNQLSQGIEPIIFNNRNHFQPIPIGHLNINELLIQNPGF